LEHLHLNDHPSRRMMCPLGDQFVTTFELRRRDAGEIHGGAKSGVRPIDRLAVHLEFAHSNGSAAVGQLQVITDGYLTRPRRSGHDGPSALDRKNAINRHSKAAFGASLLTPRVRL
jgi:hypothetical protein